MAGIVVKIVTLPSLSMGITDLLKELFGSREGMLLLIKLDKNPSQVIVIQNVNYLDASG